MHSLFTKTIILLPAFIGLFFLWSFSASAQTITLDPPSAICVTSGGVSGPQISLTWSDTFSGSNPTFEIYRMIPGETSYALVGTTSSNDFTDTVSNGLVSDKSYRYQIRGEKGGSGPISSNERDVAALYCEPVLSTSALCSADGPHNLLTWSSITGTLDKYEVLRDGLKIGETTGTSFDDGPSIEGGVAYEYKVRAIWQDATLKESAASTVTTSFCAPTLTLSASCENTFSPGGPKAELSWNSLLGVSSYEIWRKAQSESDFSLLDTVSGSTIVYVDFLVNSLNSTYYNGGDVSYRVKAVWPSADRDSAAETAAIPRCAPFLTVDTNCQDFSFDLSWTRTKDATVYNIYRDGSFIVQVSSGADLYKDFMDLTLCPNEQCTYTYTVEAAVSGNPNMSSQDVTKSVDCATVVAPDPPPHMEEPIPYCELGDSKISLGTSTSDPGWSASNNTFNYSVFRNSVEEVKRTERWYIDSNIQSGTDYPYYIIANGEGGTSTVSDNSYTITAVSCDQPSVPNITSLAAGCSAGNPHVDIAWDATTNTESYDILRGTVSGSLSVVKTFDVKPLPTNWQDTGFSISSPATYYYQVRANGPQGVPSTVSAEQSVLVDPCFPTTPNVTLSTACVSGSAEVTVSWSTDHANTDKYVIERQDAGGGNLASFPDQLPPTTSFIDTTVALDKDYEYRITAEGPTGNSSTQGFKPITSDSCLPTVPALSLTPQCNLTNAEIVLNWSTDEKNTSSYEIFRLDYDPASPIATILSPATKTWTDDGSISPIAYNTDYDYKVEAVGDLSSLRSTEGYKPVTSLDCSPPGPFTLSLDQAPQCVDAYLRADLSWTESTNAVSYDILQNQVSPVQTTRYPDVPFLPREFTDIGLGLALSFDGSNDYLEVPSSGGLNGTTELTYSAWFMARTTSGTRQLIGKSVHGGGSGRAQMGIFFEGGLFKGRAETAGGRQEVSIPASSMENRWQFATLVFNGDSLRLYLNGQQVDSILFSGTTLNSNSDPLMIGNDYGMLFYWDGPIDEARVYSRALLAIEIQNLYEGKENLVPRTGLEGLWHFDEGSGSDASDSSNNGNHGTIFGASWTTESGIFYQRDYNWQAEAFNIGGASIFATPDSDPAKDPSISRTAPMCKPPQSGVVLQTYCDLGLGAPVVDIAWSYSINTSDYEVYREEGAVDALVGTVAQTVDPALRVITDDNGGIGLSPSTAYSYYVLAKSVAALPDGVSDTISITTPICNPPTKPVITSLDFQCSSSNFPEAKVTWTDSDFTDYYTVYRDGAPFSPDIADTNAASYTLVDGGIAVDTAYTYTVRAFGPGGNTESDPAVLLDGNFCDPSIPSITSITTQCISGAAENTAEWADATPFNTVDYTIFRNTTGLGPDDPGDIVYSSVPVGTTTGTDNTLPGGIPETTYYYWIRANGQSGHPAAMSSSIFVTAPACGVVPGKPSVSSATTQCADGVPQVILDWADTTDATYYNIYRDSILTYARVPSYFVDDGVTFREEFTGADGSSWPFRWVHEGTPHNYTIQGNRGEARRASVSGTGISFPNIDVLANILDFDLLATTWSSTNCANPGFVGRRQDAAFDTFYSTQQGGCSASTHSIFKVVGGSQSTLSSLSLSNQKGSDVKYRFLVEQNGPGTDIRTKRWLAGDGEPGAWTLEVLGNTEPALQNVNGRVGFRANLSVSSGRYVRFDDFEVSQIPSTILNENQNVTYTVTAFGADTESDPSDPVSISAPSCDPSVPVLTVTPQCVSGDSQFLLDWDPDPNTEYWDVYKSRDGAPFDFLDRVFPPVTSYSDGDVESGIRYDYYITAVGFSASEVSNTDGDTALVCTDPPAKPAFINSTPEPVCFGTSSRVKLEWTDDTTGNTLSFNIRRNKLPDTGFNIRDSQDASDTDYYDLVTANEDYEYKIEAVGSGTNNIALSDPSPVVTALDCANLPPSPADLSLSSLVSTGNQVAVSLEWTDSGPEEDYRVFRSEDGGSSFDEIAHLVAGTDYPDDSDPRFYVDDTVIDGTDYVYRVYAYNDSASFDSSDPLKVFDANDEPEGGIASNDLLVSVPIAVPGSFTAQGQWIDIMVGPFQVTWDSAATTANGECVIYEVLKDDDSSFSSPTAVCSDITEESPDCRGVPGPQLLQCDDATPTLIERFYKVRATNVGGATDSNVVQLTPPLPKYREIAP